MTKRITALQVALYLWRKDGRPERTQLGEAGKATYINAAFEIFRGIEALGGKVVKEISK